MCHRYSEMVEQELLTLPGHMGSPPVFSGVRVARPLVFCVCFVDHRLSFCPFSFGHCVVCSSSMYRFWLPFWCLQTHLKQVFYKEQVLLTHRDHLVFWWDPLVFCILCFVVVICLRSLSCVNVSCLSVSYIIDCPVWYFYNVY